MKENKGITMIALVITIIVLIILAGVSINIVVGDNGIITLAQKAKENTELAQIEEEKELNSIYEQLENYNSISGGIGEDNNQLAELQNKYNKLQEEYNSLQTEYDEFKTQVVTVINNKGIETNDTDPIETIISNIEKIAGGTIETKTVRIGNANTTNAIPEEEGWTFVGAYASGAEVTNSNGHMTYCNFGFSYNSTSATGGAGSGAGDGYNYFSNAGNMYAIYARVVI